MRKVLSLCLVLAALMVAAPSLLSEDCCEVGGDANDDGVIDAYDFWFTKSFSYASWILDADYPYPKCIDQMLSNPVFDIDSSITPWDTTVPQVGQTSSADSILLYLIYDYSEPSCGPLNQ